MRRWRARALRASRPFSGLPVRRRRASFPAKFREPASFCISHERLCNGPGGTVRSLEASEWGSNKLHGLEKCGRRVRPGRQTGLIGARGGESVICRVVNGALCLIEQTSESLLRGI